MPDEEAIKEIETLPREVLAGIMASAEQVHAAGGTQIAMYPSGKDGQNLCVHEAVAASPYNIVVSSIGSGCVDVIGEENLEVLYHNNEPDPAAITEMTSKLSVLHQTDMKQNLLKNKEALYKMTELYPGDAWMKNMLKPFQPE